MEVIKVKILHLPLKAKWYEMQERGEKTEEYREITPYWEKRLALYDNRGILFGLNPCGYTHVLFRYGYTKRFFISRIDRILIGRGNPEWGAPTDRDVFIIRHHKEEINETGKNYLKEQSYDNNISINHYRNHSIRDMGVGNKVTYKRDYMIEVSADMNDRTYWKLTRKGESVNPNAEDKLVAAVMLREILRKIEN